jgi:hypothetical protein
MSWPPASCSVCIWLRSFHCEPPDCSGRYCDWVEQHHCWHHQSFLRSLVILGSGVAIWRLDGELIRACGKWRHHFIVCCWQYSMCWVAGDGEGMILGCCCCVLCVCV